MILILTILMMTIQMTMTGTDSGTLKREKKKKMTSKKTTPKKKSHLCTIRPKRRNRSPLRLEVTWRKYTLNPVDRAEHSVPAAMWTPKDMSTSLRYKGETW